LNSLPVTIPTGSPSSSITRMASDALPERPSTDAALSEASCAFPNASGCTVPPPGGPGKFYPYWTLTPSCVWEFGNMTNGNTFGQEAQYGSIIPQVGYPQMFGPVMTNSCSGA